MVDYIQGLSSPAKITIVVNKSKANAKSNLQIKNQLALSGDLDILFSPEPTDFLLNALEMACS